jgi:DNA-binding transcriptional regulator YiaG
MSSSKKTAKIVRLSPEHARTTHGQTDWKRVDAASAEEIARWQHAEGFAEADNETPLVRVVVPQTDVRALREGLGLSREEFALRFRLSLRTVQHWEQRSREPEGPSRVLLWLIAQNPSAVARQLASLQ